MSSRLRAAVVPLAAGLLAAAASSAQVFQHPPRPDPAEQQTAAARQREMREHPNQFGLQCCQILQIPGAAFTTIDPAITGTMVSGTAEGYRFIDPGSQSAEVWAPVTLPTGVQVDFLDLYFKDTEPDNEICVDLVGLSGTDLPQANVLATSCSTGSAGFGYASHLVAIPIDNDVAQNGAQYVVVVYTSFPSSFLQFRAVDLWWHRQVSPAPATATFADVPTDHPFFQFVEALSASGITGGCGNGNYCPDAPLTRKQMAAFLSKALGLYWPF